MDWADLDWFGFATQILGVVTGGALVIVANEIVEHRRRRSAHEEFVEHERAVYTAVFAIRNFILQQIEVLEEAGPTVDNLSSLEVAKNNLDRLIEKSRPGGQMLMLILFEVSLRLDDFLAASRRSLEGEQPGRTEVDRKMEPLVQSLEQFDLVSELSLEWIDEDLVEQLMGRQSSQGDS